MTMGMAAATADVREKFAEKYKRGIFSPVARHLRADLVEDRLAEGVAAAFCQYKSSVERGRPMEDALLVHACRLRAIDLSRRFAGARGARSKSDVLDERNYKAGRVEVLRLDGVAREDDDESEVLGLAQPEVLNPTRRIVSAIDLERWLSGLSGDDRMMLSLRQSGHTLGGIGAAMGVSTSAVFARLKQLGRQLARVAEIDPSAGLGSGRSGS